MIQIAEMIQKAKEEGYNEANCRGEGVPGHCTDAHFPDLYEP